MAFNILIVDDSLSMRSVIKKTIQATGIEVEKFYEAGNGKEALDVLRSQWLDIILLDYHMPGMDGMQLLCELQKDELLKTVPVVITSVEGSQKRMYEFLENGAAGYIKKPFTPEETRDKLNKVLGVISNGEEESAAGDEELDF
jgi:two-component system chemotaxis response regulator CheY